MKNQILSSQNIIAAFKEASAKDTAHFLSALVGALRSGKKVEINRALTVLISSSANTSGHYSGRRNGQLALREILTKHPDFITKGMVENLVETVASSSNISNEVRCLARDNLCIAIQQRPNFLKAAVKSLTKASDNPPPNNANSVKSTEDTLALLEECFPKQMVQISARRSLRSVTQALLELMA